MKLRTWLRLAGLFLLLGAALVLLIRSAGGELVKVIVLREVRNRVPAIVEIQDVRPSLWPPGIVVRGLEIREEKTPLLRAGELDFQLAWMASLWEGAWIGDLNVADFELGVQENSEIWRRVIAEFRPPGGEPRGAPGFVVRGVNLDRGRITVQIESLGLRTTVTDLAARARTKGLLVPALRFEIDARASIERAEAKLALRRLTVRGDVRAGTLAIDEAAVEGDSGILSVRGQVSAETARGTLDWNVILDPIFALLPEAGVVKGQGRISATFRGPISRVEATTELQARSVRIEQVEFSGAGRLQSRGLDWELSPARAEMFGGTVEGNARGRFVSNIPFEVHGRFRGWEPATFVRLFGPNTPIRGTWDGDAEMEGLLLGDDLKGSGTFTLREQQEQVTGRAQFATTRDSAEVEGMVEGSPADRLYCRYRVEGERISGEAEAESSRLSTFGPFVRIALDGHGRSRARFTGTVDDPLFTGTAEMDELAVEGIHFGRVRLPFEISRQGLRSARAEIDDGRLRATGRVALTPYQENDWSLNAQGEDLERLGGEVRTLFPRIPQLGGELDGDLRIVGRWSRLGLTGRLHVSDFSLMSESLGRFSAEFSRSDSGWALLGELRGKREERGRFQLKVDRDGKLASTISASAWRIEKFSAIHRRWPQLVAQLALSGSVAGTVARPVGELSIDVGEMEVSGRPIGDSKVTLRLEGERALLEARSGDRVRLAATVGIPEPHSFTAQGTWRDLDLGALLLPRSRLEIVTRGEGHLRGDSGSILREGGLRLLELTVGHDRLKLLNRSPVLMRIQDGTIEVADSRVEGDGQQLTFGGRFGRDESAIHAAGKGNLALLEAIVPEVTSAQGAVDVDVKAVKRGVAPWEYHGSARLQDGAIDLGLQVSVTEVSGEMQFDERRAEVRDLTGKLGEGRFLAEGEIGLDHGWDLGWALRDASFGFPVWLDYRANGNGRIEGPIGRPKIDGEVEVIQAVYDRRIEWAEFLPWFRRQAQSPRTMLTLPIDLDLHVFADGGLFVDNNLAKTEMRGDFHVDGSRESPTWGGRLDVLSGTFTFRRRSFDITAGTVQFDDSRPLNPDLELGGETTVSTSEGEYRIAVRVSGTADNPRIEFTADDPSLTENDVLALVTFGRTVAQLQSQGAGIELNEVLALTAGPRAAGEVEERIFKFFPVDRIEIEPTFSRTTGAPEPRLSIGKELAQGLRALLGTGLGAERRQDLTLEYQLTPRISVQGIWESQSKSEAGAFGGDLKFRYPFRNLTPFSMIPAPSKRTGEP